MGEWERERGAESVPGGGLDIRSSVSLSLFLFPFPFRFCFGFWSPLNLSDYIFGDFWGFSLTFFFFPFGRGVGRLCGPGGGGEPSVGVGGGTL